MRATILALLASLGIAANAFANQCYQRAYTAEHLARNPDQMVESLQVLFITEGDFFARAMARFRGDPDVYETTLECWNPEGEGADVITCAVECDGGRFTTNLKDDASILVRTRGFLVGPGCGEDTLRWVRDGDTSRIGNADTVFKLFRIPADRCY